MSSRLADISASDFPLIRQLDQIYFRRKIIAHTVEKETKENNKFALK